MILMKKAVSKRAAQKNKRLRVLVNQRKGESEKKHGKPMKGVFDDSTDKILDFERFCQ